MPNEMKRQCNQCLVIAPIEELRQGYSKHIHWCRDKHRCWYRHYSYLRWCNRYRGETYHEDSKFLWHGVLPSWTPQLRQKRFAAWLRES